MWFLIRISNHNLCKIITFYFLSSKIVLTPDFFIKWLEQETDKSVLSLFIEKSESFFAHLFMSGVSLKSSRKYFLSFFRVLKSKVNYQGSCLFLKKVGQVCCRDFQDSEQIKSSFIEFFLSKNLNIWQS